MVRATVVQEGRLWNVEPSRLFFETQHHLQEREALNNEGDFEGDAEYQVSSDYVRACELNVLSGAVKRCIGKAFERLPQLNSLNIAEADLDSNDRTESWGPWPLHKGWPGHVPNPTRSQWILESTLESAFVAGMKAF